MMEKFEYRVDEEPPKYLEDFPRWVQECTDFWEGRLNDISTDTDNGWFSFITDNIDFGKIGVSTSPMFRLIPVFECPKGLGPTVGIGLQPGDSPLFPTFDLFDRRLVQYPQYNGELINPPQCWMHFHLNDVTFGGLLNPSNWGIRNITSWKIEVGVKTELRFLPLRDAFWVDTVSPDTTSPSLSRRPTPAPTPKPTVSPTTLPPSSSPTSPPTLPPTPQLFSIVNPATGRAVGLSDRQCTSWPARDSLGARVFSPGSQLQLFYWGDNGRIFSVCHQNSLAWNTRSTCRFTGMAPISDSLAQRWRINTDGSVEALSADCANGNRVLTIDPIPLTTGQFWLNLEPKVTPMPPNQIWEIRLFDDPDDDEPAFDP